MMPQGTEIKKDKQIDMVLTFGAYNLEKKDIEQIEM